MAERSKADEALTNAVDVTSLFAQHRSLRAVVHAFRGRGFAAIAAAALLRECLRLGIEPCWSASNPISKRLAARLGYRPGEACEVLYLR